MYDNNLKNKQEKNIFLLKKVIKNSISTLRLNNYLQLNRAKINLYKDLLEIFLLLCGIVLFYFRKQIGTLINNTFFYILLNIEYLEYPNSTKKQFKFNQI